jgi:hypothetical protein
MEEGSKKPITVIFRYGDAIVSVTRDSKERPKPHKPSGQKEVQNDNQNVSDRDNGKVPTS